MKIKKNIARLCLIATFFTLINSVPIVVEASESRKYTVNYENKILKSDTQKVDEKEVRNKNQQGINLEEYKFPSNNYKISFPTKRNILLSTEDSVKFYHNNFMITSNIITIEKKLPKNNNLKKLDVLKEIAINLQDYPGYKVVTSSYLEKTKTMPEYYYYELKNRNDIITFRNLTIIGLIPLKNNTRNNDYLMVSLNCNAKNILTAQDIFNKIFMSVKLNKKELSKYKSRERVLDNNSLNYKMKIPKNFYSHTKNSDQLVILEPVSLSLKNTAEIRIRKFVSDKYSDFSKSDRKKFKVQADLFINELTKYSTNKKIENYSIKTIDQKNAIIFKTIESNSQNYITTLNCYIFYDNFGYAIKYSSTNLNQSSKDLDKIINCFLTFKNN